jgi:hypothetical protein
MTRYNIIEQKIFIIGRIILRSVIFFGYQEESERVVSDC